MAKSKKDIVDLGGYVCDTTGKKGTIKLDSELGTFGQLLKFTLMTTATLIFGKELLKSSYKKGAKDAANAINETEEKLGILTSHTEL